MVIRFIESMSREISAYNWLKYVSRIFLRHLSCLLYFSLLSPFKKILQRYINTVLIFSLITIQPDRTGKYCNNLKIFVSTKGINIIIIIIVQRYYPCAVHRIKSISRNRANLIAPPPSCVANVRFNIGRYPGENKSAGNSIRYLGTAIHRKRLIFAVGNPATEYRGSRVPAFHVFQPCPQWY